MDLEGTIIPDSTQINADDLVAGPHTYTIESVSAGNAEQPVNIHLKETDRAYRPGKSMRRVLVQAWGKDSAVYAGRRLTLFRDATVKWAGVAVGGVRISHLSDIEKTLTVALTETRGKRKPYKVEPLAATPEDTPATVDRVAEFVEAFGQAGSLDQLKALWQAASAAGVASDPRVVAAKDAAKVRLTP